ncbi:MAG: GNAT family N-acetyltransferase [Bacteroidales bacterium]|jgi:ribosomal protein S18 acetylase RimI-like enzyme|nr:GNAT family N-acetyltransferase [Bacteroidales bacterium]
MKLKRITNSKNPESKTLINLHNDIFPEYERFYKTHLWANLIDNASFMHFNAIYENDELAGFFIYWDLEDAYYIHFIAVRSEMRNRKIGQQILDWVSANLHKPVFLESEIPYDEMTSRRLSFYKRNGFSELANDPKILSEVRKGGHPLWFMGTQKVNNLDDYLIKVRENVYYATGE